MNMFETDGELIHMGLSRWANYIETNDSGLSRNDAIQQKKPEIIRALSEDQIKLVSRIRDLAKHHLTHNKTLEDDLG